MVEDKNKMMFHADCMQYFKECLYEGVFTETELSSYKKVIKMDADDGKIKIYGYYLTKDKTLYFMHDSLINKLPFKVNENNLKEVDYKGDVFKLILPPVQTIKFNAQKEMSFRNLIDLCPNFDHSEPLDFTIAKIIMMTAMVDRINARIVTEAGFGKDSIAELQHQLVGSCANIYGATFAKLEYLLTNKIIVLNEMGNLSSTEKVSMQNFLLAAGAYFNVYTKRTRQSSFTKEIYDISKLSLIIFHNLPNYYISKGQEYFENMFTPALPHRFMAFVLDGRLTTDFESAINVKEIVDNNMENYKKIIRTIIYFQQNPIKKIKYEIPSNIIFSNKEKRHKRTFYTILKYIGEYCNDQEEFIVMATKLYNSYRKYNELIKDTNQTLS